MYTPNLTPAARKAESMIDNLLSKHHTDYEACEKEIDALAEEMKQSIIHAESDYDPSLPTYYVSNDGDDSADGLSPETAWKTIEKINEKDTTPEHCNILFRRGDVFRGCVKPPHDSITYSAYGTGKKPCIYGSKRNYADPSLWELTEYPHVYRTTACGKNVGLVAIDHSDEYGRYDEIMGIRSVIGVNGFTGPADLRANFWFYSNLEKEELYLRCDFGNPGEVFHSIELGERGNLFTNGNHIKVDNLCIKFTGSHGVGIGGVSDYTVQNCIFAYLGGSILTGFNGGNITGYGNAVQVYGGCDGYYVNGNWIYQIYDTAITHQFSGRQSNQPNHMKDVEYIGNLCEYCHWSIEYYNPDSQVEPSTPRTVKNVNVSHNLLRYGCYGWGSVGRQSAGALFNSFCLTPNTENFTANANIMDRSLGNMVRLNRGGDEKLQAKGNLMIQKEGRSFGYCYGQLYPYSAEKAADYARDLFHDPEAQILYSKA